MGIIVKQKYRFYFSWTQLIEHAQVARAIGLGPEGPLVLAKLDDGTFADFTEAEQVEPVVEQAYKLIAPAHTKRFSDSVLLGEGEMITMTQYTELE